MKIIHVAEYASGGVATYLKNTIDFQLKDKQVSSVILLNSKSNSEEINFISHKFIHKTYKYHRSIQGIFRLLKVRSEIDKFTPDVVHFHSSFSGIIRLTYLIKPAKYKVVYCPHGWSFIQQNKGPIRKKIYEFIERCLARKTDAIINISKSEQEEAIKHNLPSSKLHLIYNSISSERKEYAVRTPFTDKKRKKLLFIGRFDAAKGLSFLLDNGKLKENGIELVVIGASVLQDQNLKYDDRNIRFLGWVDNEYIGSYMMHCDAVIVPSMWEGFGLVALEAMRAHKMVIASNVGGLPELIIDKKNGLLFKKGSAKSLNERLNEFAGMSDSAIKIMGERGYDLFRQKYNRLKLNEKLLKIYSEK
ncbi:glycosyltransferase [Levilactobacillus brevis]|uniref:glycosyltransferase n=1 Tax=Levilactobacillus brevis TaxID=1580 RepID=UPI00351319F0